MASNNSLLLFKQEGQHIYDYSNVYDPDVHGSNVANSGKIVPAVRSIVIDNRTSTWRVYLVSAVDPVTFKVSYVDFPYKTIDTSSIVLNYGNDFFMLYYDNRVSPTRLIVDSKMILFGANLAKYRLMKDGFPISIFDQQTETGMEAVNEVPIAEVSNQYTEGIRRCSPCYTTTELQDGDLVTLELYDSTGVMIGEVELVAKQATILNSLSASVNPITNFTAECNQVDGDEWYIYKGQSVDNLSIYPMITMANNVTYNVPRDDSSCFIYGLDEIDSTQVGAKFKVLVKYFVNDRYPVDPDLNVVVSGTKRILYSEHTVKVVDKPVGSIAKLSVIPVWRQDLGSYDLRFIAYTINRYEPIVVTDRIVNIGSSPMTFKTFTDMDNVARSVLIDGSFDPTAFGSKQTFTIKFLATEIGSVKQYHQQSFSIVLIDPATVPDANGSRAVWNIEDPTNTAEPYGIDNADYNRPEIYWDADAHTHFFDSTNKFRSVTEFVNTFYRLADPPYKIETETQAPYPSHFRIKDVNGNVLVPAMEVGNYMRGFLINKVNTTDPVEGSIVVDGDNTVELPVVVILEFLLNNSPIYGVPVIIRNMPISR